MRTESSPNGDNSTVPRVLTRAGAIDAVAETLDIRTPSSVQSTTAAAGLRSQERGPLRE